MWNSIKYFYAPLVIFLLSAAALHGQNEKMLRWDPVYGAGGYIVEIRDSSGGIIVEKEVQVTYYDVSAFPEGKYEYRITTLNKLKEKGGSTGWIGISIEKALVARIKSVSIKKLAHSYDNPEVIVYGNNFTDDCVFYLRRGDDKIVLDYDFISSTEVRFKWKPRKGDNGVYDLLVAERSSFEGILESAIEVIDPDIPVIESVSKDNIIHSKKEEIVIKGSNLGDNTIIVIKNKEGKTIPAKVVSLALNEIVISITPLAEDKGDYQVYALKKDFFVSEKKFDLSITDAGDDGGKKNLNLHAAFGWQYNLPMGDWAEYLDKSPVGFQLYAAWPFAAWGVTAGIPVLGQAGIDFRADYSIYVLTRGSSEESYSTGSASVGIFYPLPLNLFSGSFDLLLNVNTGLAWSSITIIENDQAEVFSSLDPLISAGLTARYRFFSPLFIMTSVVYQRIFYVSHPLDEVKISLCIGVVF